MSDSNERIGVMVLEPQAPLLQKLCDITSRIWGEAEVLPRMSAKECAYASNLLDFEVVVVRSTIARSSPIIVSTLMDLYAKGAHVIMLQDTGRKLSDFGTVSFARLHIMSDKASDQDLMDLLTLCKIRSIVNL